MIYAFIAAFSIAALALIGSLFFGRTLDFVRGSRIILPIAVGTFLSVIFFELVPEALHEDELLGSIAIVGGFLFFYALAHILRTYHHHHTSEASCEHTHEARASLVLVGDAVHNFADGIVIATAFLIDPTVGIITTIGIALHEIPQEIAEFSLLMSAGYTKTKALLYNFLSALSVVLGVLVAWYFVTQGEGLLALLIGLAAGNLLYIAASDILPELYDTHVQSGTFWKSFLATLLATLVMSGLLIWSHENFGEDMHGDESIHEAHNSHAIAHHQHFQG